MSKITGDISYGSPLLVEWVVDDFPLAEEGYQYLESPTFQYLDKILTFQCCTMSNIFPGNVSLYLYYKKGLNSQDYFTYQLGIRSGDGTVYESITSDKDPLSTPLLISIPTLRKDKWLIAPQGIVTFFCIIRSKAITSTESQTIKLESTSISTQTLEENFKTDDLLDCEEQHLSIQTGANKLAQDLKDLMLNEVECDITIKINERDIKAHRFILVARSSVFLSMFSHDTIERKTGIITIEDCNPDIFHTFLMFLYTGEVQEFTSDNVCDLYVVAEKYDVQELKLKCINYMVKYLSIDNFCDIMCLALKYKENPLIKAATDFFVKNAKKIIVTVQWQCFLKEYPLECNELTIKLLAHVIPE